jgi:WD40 repeat protein
VTPDGRACLIDPWTGESRVEFVGPDLSPWALLGLLSFSADGRVFAAHTNANNFVLWETGSGCELTRCEVVEDTRRIALSPKGSRLAILNSSGKLSVFDGSSRRTQILTSGSGRLVKFHSLSFSSDETLLAIGLETAPGGPQPPEVWDIAKAKRLAVFPGRAVGQTVEFLPYSRALILVDGTRPRIWRLDPPGEPDALAGHTAEAWAVAFSPDGKILATGSDDTKESQTIKLWDPATGQLLAGWKAHTATVAALAFSPDGRMLASGSLDSGKPGHPNVILWDVASHECLASLQGHTGSVRSIVFSSDGRLLATAGDDMTARLWDVSNKTTRAVLTGHTKNLTSISFSSDGRLLASVSNDSTVRFWDVATGHARATLPEFGNVNAVAFSPDCSLVASANEGGEIKLWDTPTGTVVRAIRGEAGQLRCLAFTPDGRSVVAAGKGKVIRVWDVATGQELLSLDGHKAQINALALSPDGSILASCSHDGAVRLWRAK